ncbi:MAG: NifB/NifX family molybdenum-iron cluster-binding protein [Candidatus Bathyarchaeia archaeon]
MVKLAIPVERFDGEASVISYHFGRAPTFALVNLNPDGRVESIESVPNVGEHFGGHGAADALALRLNVDAVVVRGMGPRGIQAFREEGIAVLTGEVDTVREALDAYIDGRLIALTEPCREARHH